MISQNPSDVKNQKIIDAISQTAVISTEPSHVRMQLFQLAREIRTIVGFDKPISDKFKKVVVAWHKQSRIHLENESIDILWAHFKTSWNKIRYPTDEELFCKLVEIASQSEYPPVCNKHKDVTKDLIRLCAVLDAHWSPEPFYLSCRMAEHVFGYSHSNMAILLELLVMDEVLELIEKGKFIGKTGQTGRASRYKFLADKGTIDMRLIKSIQQVNKEVD
jgi:hypothetical protein